MYATRVLKGPEIDAEGLVEPILELDRRNMMPLLEKLGREFPEAIRRKGLHDPLTNVVALYDGQQLVGYAQFSRDLHDYVNLYFGSIQVTHSHCGGPALGMLLADCLSLLQQEKFHVLTTHVQRQNPRMIRLCQRLGFRIIPSTTSDKDVHLVAERQLLVSPHIRRLQERLLRRGICRSRDKIGQR